MGYDETGRPACGRAADGTLLAGLHLGRFVLIGLAVVVAVTLGLVFSPWLSVRHITVQGTEHLSQDEVVAALDAELGRPLIGLSREDVGNRLQQFSWIESYDLRASLPDTLSVTIVERIPVGVYRHGGESLLVDEAGVVVDTAAEPQAGYPILDVPDTDPTSPAFSSVARVLRGLDEGLRAQVARAHATTQDDVTLTLTGGATVVWGDVEQSALKARVLTALLADRPDAKTIDVSSPSLPVVS